MCGIFGFTRESDDKPGDLKKMAAQQLHRGPDGEGYYTSQGIALGMRRLSIIDLEHGQQPFFNRDKTIIAICNGEIYNYIELREELKNAGYEFQTASDVEVIPHLYEKYGLDFVKKLNGMFAIAVYDEKRRRLMLVRDRLGIKPLYYSLRNGNISFSSELRSILAIDGAGKEIDHDALSAYLDMLYIPAPNTPFRSIKKLGSGSILLFDEKGMRIEKYWEPGLKKPVFTDEDNTADEIDKLLKDSVKIEMRSDVPVGALLSGGVDSSCVVALASMLAKGKFSTFHTEWPATPEKTNEKPFAQMVSDRYKTDHHVREISEVELISLLPKLVWHLEEPFADGAFVPTYALSKFASEKVKVVLSGAGGDELFGGYGHHGQVPHIKALIKKLIFGVDRNNSYYDKWVAGKKNAWSGIFEWYKPRAFKDRIDSTYKKFRHVDELNATMLSDLLIYLQDDILFMTDKMTMAASLECRVPLLDHRLVEFSLAVDSALKIRGNEKKYIFKKLMEKYLPKEVLYRKKEGFGAPVHTWVNRYKKRHFDKVLLTGIVSSSVASDNGRIKDLCKKEVLEYTEAWEYWKIMLMELWFRIFIEGQSYDRIFS